MTPDLFLAIRNFRAVLSSGLPVRFPGEISANDAMALLEAAVALDGLLDDTKKLTAELQACAEIYKIVTGLMKFTQCHHSCASLVLLLTDPPQRQPCSCGLVATLKALETLTRPVAPVVLGRGTP